MNLYCGRLETLNLDCAKTPGLGDRKWVHIANIEPFAIAQSRGFSRTSKSMFLADRSISRYSNNPLFAPFSAYLKGTSCPTYTSMSCEVPFKSAKKNHQKSNFYNNEIGS